MRLVVALSLVLTAACSSSNFDVVDSVDSGGTDSASVDSGADLGVPGGDTGADAGPPSCGVLGTNPDTVYVDARFTGESNGTAACPAKSIREGLGILAGLTSGKRTLRIAGGTASAPIAYEETAALVVKNGTAVVGDGVERVTVRGGGACGTSQCVFVLEGGTSIEGMTIEPGARIGLAMIPGVLTGVAAKNVLVTRATGATNHAVYVKGQGAVELGPSFRATKNEGAGVMAEDIFSVHVLPSSQFNNNGGGIVMIKGQLNFDGGEVNSNAAAGITLTSTPKHSITGLTARDNGGPGIFVDVGAGLKLRGSTLVKNRLGLLVKFGVTLDIDLGTTLDNGKNVFGTSAEKNNRAAICFATVRSTKLPGVGNKWSACPIVTTPSSGCDALSSYSEIYYAAPSAGPDPGAPIDWGTCEPG